ncbi:MAG: ABC transporter permease [Caldilineaceae bacterium]
MALEHTLGENTEPFAAESLPSDDEWTLILRPRRPWLDLRLGELWQARDLIMLFVRRDFVSTYKQTILGPLWYIIQPLLTTITFTIIFGKVAQLSTDGLPQFLFYMSGTVIWGYFAMCLNKTSNTFVSNRGLFGKVYFPRLAVPISVAISNLVNFGIQFLLFVVFVIFFMVAGSDVHLNAAILLTPLLILMLAGIGLGFGIIVSSMTTRYRDLTQLVAFGVQLLMYATPVIYPLSAVPERLRPIIALNPLTAIIETFRYGYLGAGDVGYGGLIYSFCFMVVVLLTGLIYFNRIEQTFMDTV